MELILPGALALVIGLWMVVRRESMSRSANAWQVKVNKSDPTPPPDYRRGTLFGGLFMMAAGVALVIVGLMI